MEVLEKQVSFISMPTRRVLIIEDNDPFTKTVLAVLAECGEYVADGVGTLASAIEKLHQSTYDFILCDLGLPDSRGIGIVLEIKKHTSSPVIVISGTDITDVVITSLGEIAEGYIIKCEFSLPKFQATLQRIGMA